MMLWFYMLVNEKHDRHEFHYYPFRLKINDQDGVQLLIIIIAIAIDIITHLLFVCVSNY